MPTLRYPLEANGPKRLELAWEGLYRNFTIKLDDQVVGQVPGGQALAAGHSLTLPDGSTLTLKATGMPLFNELRVLRNGRPLPGSATDPASRLRNAYQVIFFLAGLNLLLGLLAALFSVTVLQALGLGWGTVILGAAYLVLGYLVRERSWLALLLAAGLYGLETLMSLMVPILAGASPNVATLLVRLVLLYAILQAWPALRRLRQGGPEAPAAAPGAG